jgi:hypothetical protein
VPVSASTSALGIACQRWGGGVVVGPLMLLAAEQAKGLDRCRLACSVDQQGCA